MKINTRNEFLETMEVEIEETTKVKRITWNYHARICVKSRQD